MLFAVVTACSKSDTGKSGHSYALLQKDVPGVYENENSLFIYDNDLYQYAYNTSRHSFRIQNTSQSRYMACMLETAPVVDRYVKVPAAIAAGTFPLHCQIFPHNRPAHATPKIAQSAGYNSFPTFICTGPRSPLSRSGSSAEGQRITQVLRAAGFCAAS